MPCGSPTHNNTQCLGLFSPLLLFSVDRLSPLVLHGGGEKQCQWPGGHACVVLKIFLCAQHLNIKAAL